MQPKSAKLLEDIRDAAAFIRQSTAGKSLDDYRTDRILRQAVERSFEVLGEAALRLSRHDPEIATRIDDYPQIIAFRNVLIHGYDLIDVGSVWQVIQDDLPKLEQQVTKLLANAD